MAESREGPLTLAESEDVVERQGDPHCVALRTSDPDDDDFADLEPLAEAIGDARIVMLGEPSHGDGATFRMMDRLIRFLHRNLGFTVLAWEQGAWDCTQIDAALDGEAPISQAVSQHLGDCWRDCREVWPLLRYLRRTRHSHAPLRLAGIDPLITSRKSGRRLARRLIDGLPTGVVDASRFQDLLGALADNPYFSEWENGEDLREALSRLEGHLSDWAGILEDVRVLERIKTFCPRLDNPEGNNLRDARMAENLIDLAERVYPHRRLILRAMNGHIMRQLDTLADPDGNPSQGSWVPLGELAWRHFGPLLYSIAFLAGEGRFGWACNSVEHHRDLGPPPAGSVESLMIESGYEFAFVDLRGLPEGHAMRGPLLARPIAYVPAVARWDQVSDAFIFTKTMFPARPVNG